LYFWNLFLIEFAIRRGVGLCWIIQERYKEEGKRRTHQRVREVTQGLWAQQCPTLIASKKRFALSLKILKISYI